MLKIFKEPSSYAGLAAVIAGIGQIAKINEAPVIADSVIKASEPIINGDYIGAAMAFFGALAIILREKSK